MVASLSMMAESAASLIWLRSELRAAFSLRNSYISSNSSWPCWVFSCYSDKSRTISSSFSLSLESSSCSDSSWFLYCKIDLYFSSYYSARAVWNSSLVFDLMGVKVPPAATFYGRAVRPRVPPAVSWAVRWVCRSPPSEPAWDHAYLLAHVVII